MTTSTRSAQGALARQCAQACCAAARGRADRTTSCTQTPSTGSTQRPSTGSSASGTAPRAHRRPVAPDGGREPGGRRHARAPAARPSTGSGSAAVAQPGDDVVAQLAARPAARCRARRPRTSAAGRVLGDREQPVAVVLHVVQPAAVADRRGVRVVDAGLRHVAVAGAAQQPAPGQVGVLVVEEPARVQQAHLPQVGGAQQHAGAAPGRHVARDLERRAVRPVVAAVDADAVRPDDRPGVLHHLDGRPGDVGLDPDRAPPDVDRPAPTRHAAARAPAPAAAPGPTSSAAPTRRRPTTAPRGASAGAPAGRSGASGRPPRRRAGRATAAAPRPRRTSERYAPSSRMRGQAAASPGSSSQRLHERVDAAGGDDGVGVHDQHRVDPGQVGHRLVEPGVAEVARRPHQPHARAAPRRRGRCRRSSRCRRRPPRAAPPVPPGRRGPRRPRCSCRRPP